jgi:hypothetical protein
MQTAVSITSLEFTSTMSSVTEVTNLPDSASSYDTLDSKSSESSSQQAEVPSISISSSRLPRFTLNLSALEKEREAENNSPQQQSNSITDKFPMTPRRMSLFLKKKDKPPRELKIEDQSDSISKSSSRGK